MAYDTNPRLPRLRARAVEMVREGKTVTEVARYFGFTKGAISKWCKKYPANGAWIIPTKVSSPKSHPAKIEKVVAYRIRELRLQLKGRCAQLACLPGRTTEITGKDLNRLKDAALLV